MKIFSALIVGMFSAFISFSSVAADWKPTEDITIIVPYKAGGGTDMRIVDRLREWLEQKDRGIMTFGVWILVAVCLAVFVVNVVRCYHLLK